MAMTPQGIGAITQGVTGGLTIIEGKLDKRKANKAEKALGQRPVYNITEPTLKNQFMAENVVQEGLSEESKLMYSQRADRGLSESIDALLKVGGGVNSVSDLYSIYQDDNVDLANLNDQIKFRNQQLLMQQNKEMSDELDKAWQLNTFDPWKDEKQRIAEMRTIAESKVMAGRSMLAGGASAMASQIGDMNGNKTTQTNKPQTPMIGNMQNAMDSERGYYDQMYRKPTPQSYFQQNGQDANMNTNYYLNSIMGNIG